VQQCSDAFSPAAIRHRHLRLEPERFRLFAEGGTSVPLTLGQVRLLTTLMHAPHEIHTTARLCRTLGGGLPCSEPALRVSLSRLRTALRDAGLADSFVKSVRGAGYVFDLANV